MEVVPSCKDTTGIWLDLLEQNQMKNTTYYSKALCRSQRVRLKIEKMKALKRKSQVHPESNTPIKTASSISSIMHDKPTLSCYTDSNNTASDSGIDTPCSLVSYRDNNKLDKGNNIDLLYISSKALPIVNKMYDDTIPTGPPRCPLPAIPSISDENQRLDSAVDLATLHDKGLPSLPSLPSRRKKKNKPLPSTPRPSPPPPPKITTNTPIQMKPQPSSAASKDAAYGVPILHVEKKKLGLKGLITRTYRLDSIIVTRNVFPNGLLMAKDCYTDRRMAVLPIMAKTTQEDPFGFTFVRCTSKTALKMTREQKNHDLSHLVLVPDDRMQTALFMWVKCQHLPSLSLASQVFRRGLKLYVVYDTLLFQH